MIQQTQIISRISKGTKMDQIYIPKNRIGFSIGDYVIIKLFEDKIADKPIKPERPLFYGIKHLAQFKLKIINEIFSTIENSITEKTSNTIITGSFLEGGYNFNDIDVLIIAETKQTGKIKEKISSLKNKLKDFLGVDIHFIILTQNELSEGLKYDPLYENMLSKCISKKKIILNVKRKINAKLLDLNLLKSKVLIDNFDILSRDEKYYLTKNLIAIYLFVKNKRISEKTVSKAMKDLLSFGSQEIKENRIEKSFFLRKYKEAYQKTFDLIMNKLKEETKNGAEQD